MTVETPLSRQQYNTNGTVGPWTVSFPFLANEDLAVIYTDVDGTALTLTLDSEYTVTGAGGTSGTVTTTTAFPPGGTITVLRDMEALQQDDYVEGDDLPAETLERGLDRLTMLIQQALEVMARALVFAPSDPYGSELPAAAARANRVLAFDSDGRVTLAIPVDGSAGTLALDLANTVTISKGDAMLGVKAPFVGAVGRTQHNKNVDWVSVTDFGADPTGVAPCQDAFNAAAAAGVKNLWIPDGIYNFTGSFILPQNMQVQGSSGANLCAGAAGITIISAPTNCYGSILRNLRTFGLGQPNVTGFDISNLRVQSGVYDCSSNNMLNGFIARTGCFGTPLVNFTCQDVDNGIQVLANGSAMQIINPVLDNTPTALGTGTGRGIYIALGASDNIGIMISSGYVQGYTTGIEDCGIGTIINGVYTELCSSADIYLNGARKADIRSHQFFGPSGAAGIKARNTDSCEVWAPNMGSGARTVLYDVDNTNTNFVRHDIPSAASYGTPTGSLTNTGCSPIKTEGTSTATVFGSTSAGAAGAYTAQTCKWKKVDNIGFVDVTLTWTGHTGTGNIVVALNLPSNMNPASFTNPTLSLNVTVCGVAFTGPVVSASFNGTGTQLTLIQSSTAGAQSLVPLPAAGTLTIKGSFPIS